MTLASADTAQPAILRDTLPQKRRGRDAKSVVARMATSVPN